MFLAILIGEALLPRNETVWMYLSIRFVPVLRYVVGRWLNGRLGYIARLCLPRVLRGLLTVTAVSVLSVSIADLTPRYHRRAADIYSLFTGIEVLGWAVPRNHVV